MDVTLTQPSPSPLESLVIGDNRIAAALWEENYGPPRHRLDYLKERFKEAGYDVEQSQ